jgi:hypothetical protein
MNRPQTDLNDEEFLAFDKSYLSESFPNPKRIGCPAYSSLTQMAEYLTSADPSVRLSASICPAVLPASMNIW